MAKPMKMSLTPYTVIKLVTRFLSGAAVGASHSKKVRALSGLRMALTPNPTKMVAIALAAMWRKGEWEMTMFFKNCRRWSVADLETMIKRIRVLLLRNYTAVQGWWWSWFNVGPEDMAW